MTKKSNVKRAINRFNKAAQAFAWKGTMPPEAHEHIEKEYHSSKKALESLFNRLVDKLVGNANDEALKVLEQTMGIEPMVAHADTIAGHLGYPAGSVSEAMDFSTGKMVKVREGVYHSFGVHESDMGSRVNGRKPT